MAAWMTGVETRRSYGELVDPQHIRYFIAVVDHGSINAAADAIEVTQPTISQALRSLERELKTALFYRIGRGMVPTSAGHALIGPARTILRDMATAGSSVPDAEGNLHGRVDVRAHPAVITGMLPRVIAEFHRRHPQVRVTVATMYDEGSVPALLRDAVCELLVVHLPLIAGVEGSDRSQGLTILELGTQVYDIALPPDGKPRIGVTRWADLDEEMVVVPQGTLHAQRLYDAMTPRQQGRRPAVVITSREARLAFCLAGVGATWIERSARERALQHGARVHAMDPEIPAPYGLIYQDETLSPAARAFVDVAVELCGAPPARATYATQPPQAVGAKVARNADAAGES